MIFTSCHFCKKEFLVKPSESKYSKKLFCSVGCYRSSMVVRVLKKCCVCGKQVSYTPSQIKKIKGGNYYCSKKCYGISISKSIRCSCKECGHEFSRTPCQIKKGGGVFCSSKCQHKYHIGKNHCSWKGGISKQPYPFDFNFELKDLIRKRDNYKCKMCGIPQQECINPLCVHHIDYDKNNINPHNLVSLCHRCHTRTNYDREVWKNHFIERGLQL